MCFITLKMIANNLKCKGFCWLHFSETFMCRNTCVTMGATISAPEYNLKVADVCKVRNLNAIAKNTLWCLKNKDIYFHTSVSKCPQRWFYCIQALSIETVWVFLQLRESTAVLHAVYESLWLNWKLWSVFEHEVLGCQTQTEYNSIKRRQRSRSTQLLKNI